MVVVKRGWSIIFLMVMSVWGYDPVTHMYLGTRPEAIEFWEAFGDPEFADELDAMLVKKFYLIGLTLPDLLTSESQAGIREFLDILYDYRDYATGPLKIRDWTHSNVEVEITFPGSHPNTNLEKMREMALYARDAGWSSLEKAMIYGAYLHVVQDLYAHMETNGIKERGKVIYLR